MMLLLKKSSKTVFWSKSKFSTNSSSNAKGQYDVAVIGGGPAGYVAAIRAAQLGKTVACIEKSPTLGGTCLNVGCIPSKTLLNISHHYESVSQNKFDEFGFKTENVQLDVNTMMKKKDQVVNKLTSGIQYLFKKNKVDWIKGVGLIDANGIRVKADNDSESQINADEIIIASGSVSSNIPGINIDESNIVSSTGALSFTEVPETLGIIGGGIIGLEIGSMWRRLGAKVKVIEFLSNIGGMGMDREVSKEFQKVLIDQGLEIMTNRKFLNAVNTDNSRILVETESVSDLDEKLSFDCDKLLICVGRKPNTQNLIHPTLIEKYPSFVNQKGFINVNENNQTEIDNIYAIGDCTNLGPMLAHKGEDEAVKLVERLFANSKKNVCYKAIPSVVYTYPEVAWVGSTEEELKAAGTEYRVGKFRMVANSRAVCNGDTTGFVKVLAQKSDGKLLGAHMICPNAGEMIYGISAILQYDGSAEDLHTVCFPHPTLSEAIKEAMSVADPECCQAINA